MKLSTTVPIAFGIACVLLFFINPFWVIPNLFVAIVILVLEHEQKLEKYVSGRTEIIKRKKDFIRDVIENYDKAIRLKSDNAEFYNNRGVARQRKIECVRELDDATYPRRDAAKVQKENWDEVIADFSEAIRLKSDYTEAYTNRGSAKGYKGDLDGAIADYDTAIRLKPDDALAYNSRGVAKMQQGNWDEAIADFSEAIRLKPDFALAYSNRGSAKSDSDKEEYRDSAIKDFEKFLSLAQKQGNFELLAFVRVPYQSVWLSDIAV